MRLKFRIVGQTSDNKLLFAGVFEFYDTKGLPLDVLFDLMIKKGWMPSWIDFYEEALKNIKTEINLKKAKQIINGEAEGKWQIKIT